MELNSSVVTTPPRAAASVVLLRPGPGGAGLEVLLVRRHQRSGVLGGAHVFPGGKLDEADADEAVLDRLDRPWPALQAALAEPELSPRQAAALHVAALREAFEEAGVLLAQGADGQALGDTASARRQLAQGMGLGELLAQRAWRLDTRQLLPWSRWITPRTPSVTTQRFDTRFFVSVVPPAQEARHDDHETTETLWLAPRAALERYWAREIELAAPQIMTLVHLSRHASVAAVLAEARARPPGCVEPEPFERDGTRVVTYPGDERHSVRAPVLPGPTRLVFRERRFEPESGRLESLFE